MLKLENDDKRSFSNFGLVFSKKNGKIPPDFVNAFANKDLQTAFGSI